MSGPGSSGDENYIVPAQVDATGQTFDDQANGISEQIGSLTSQLGALGNCWGNDEPGNAFGGDYQHHVQAFLSGCRTIVNGLEDVATRLHEMAKAVEDVGAKKTIG